MQKLLLTDFGLPGLYLIFFFCVSFGQHLQNFLVAVILFCCANVNPLCIIGDCHEIYIFLLWKNTSSTNLKKKSMMCQVVFAKRYLLNKSVGHFLKNDDEERTGDLFCVC